MDGALSQADHGPAIVAIRALYTYSEGMDRAAAEAAIDSNLWARCVARLRGEILNQPRLAFGGELADCHAFLRSAAAYEADGNSAHLQPMVPLVIGAARRHFRPMLEAAAVLRQTADLRNPASWYPDARKIRRKIVMHMGPTNSGKTYSALQRLREGKQGVYCGPLRLLALEVYESLNQQGAITNLVTGQERREVMFASHTSCTVEMTNLDKEYDVAVIDEVQMIGDESRGWAWTRALLGVQAREVHVCGDPASAPVVRKLAAACGDELEERVYERLTPLSVSEESLGGTIRGIRKGDAVVAFSRRDIYQLRRLIERSTGHKCCVVYGRLPPETRNSQARLFNDPTSGYDVLVASDAIGMGLNLNIRRVVFSTLTKFNGSHTAVLSASQMKQIAGRAGRAGGIYPEGEVSTFDDEDLPLLAQGMVQPSEPVIAAGLQPNTEQVVQFAESWRGIHGSVPNLSRLLANFLEASQLDGDYFMCDNNETMRIAQAIEGVPNLTLAQQHDLTAAPVRLRDPDIRACFLRYAEALATSTPIAVDVQLPISSRASARHLDVLESRMQAVELYCWLANRFPLVFTDLDAAEKLRARAITSIESGLMQLSTNATEHGIKEANARRAQIAKGSDGAEDSAFSSLAAAADAAAGFDPMAGLDGHDASWERR
ncbi:hypothetical protein FNF29_02316 [Cafeteria roenbergensis]|uniref:RNA helicase n=1 Tax=Cafeteria roenbergensis TaxID=33653 RepID=A0A5A8CQH8_CAFRO|nr:hypothetical protein FNF29_02316 [Cafeteria roenbergensis]|eukprot:KAA0154787.1 hypothetical protein FNF29_02316 [Cafeteria roenbergensis]